VLGRARLLLADNLPHGVNALATSLRVEGRFAGQQFVEQYPQAVNVAAGVDVQPGSSRLLGAHVGRRAKELLHLRNTVASVNRPSVALAIPKSITFGTGTVVHRDQNVRRLESR
jgi:hypothetical protein